MPGVAEEVANGGMTRIRPTTGYYRQANGWITTGPGSDLDGLHFAKIGMTYLTKYGRFDMATPYAASHPLEALFMRGGAVELPIEQIIENGFHVNPPIIPSCGRVLTQFHKQHGPECFEEAEAVEFPQLAKAKVSTEVFPCSFCNRDPMFTRAARDQHERVMHKDEKATNATGEAITRSLAPLLGGAAPAVDVAEAARSAVADLLKDMDLTPEQLAKLQAAGSK